MLVGAYNIFSNSWLDGFFPEDLPADWRIEYYSNEFDLLHLPAAIWDDSEFTPFDEPWPDGLTGILEINQSLAASLHWPKIELWAEQCDDFTATLEPAVQCSSKISSLVFSTENEAMLATSDSQILLRLQPQQFDLKLLKSDIEQLASLAEQREAFLILDGSPAELDKIRTLIELMGL